MATESPEAAPVETAKYVADMAKELEGLAAKAGLQFLAYLLAMVAQEAEGVTKTADGESGA